MKLIASLLCLSIFSCSVYSQDLTNKGKDFWLGYGYHVSYTAGNSQEMVLYFATDAVTTVTVEIPGLGYSKTYNNLPANTIFESDLMPKSGPYDARLGGEGVYNSGIHVFSDKPIVAYAHIYNASISGATLLFPTATLGKDYYSINYTQKSNANASNGFFFVVAADTGTTTVEITPIAQTLNHPAGAPFTVSLTQGQIYNVMGIVNGQTGVDLTGSRIRSISTGANACKRIAVFSGSGKIYINCGPGQANSADNLFSQAFPKSAWGEKFLTAPTQNMSYNYFRVGVSDPSAVVKVNGSVVTGLINNFYYDLPLTNQPCLIESDKPATVAQYITTAGSGGVGTCGNRVPGIPADGDPEMIYLSPIEQTTDKVILNSTPHFSINEHFINIIIKSNAVGSVLIDGQAPATSFASHPGDPNYSYAQVPVTAGQHVVQADSGFNVIAYGYGGAESYGYNGGTNIKDLYQFISIINPNSIVNNPTACSGSPFYFSITLPYQPLSLYWNFHDPARVNQSVNAPVPDSSYFSHGKTVYMYKLPNQYSYQIGTYPITVIANNPTPDGCSGEQQIDFDLNVYDPPVSDFYYQSNGCVNSTVQFRDTSQLNGRPAYKWFWDFGDGQTSTSKNPTHVYSKADSFKVRYAVITDVGCLSDTVTKTVYITNVPIAKFTVSSPVCIGKSLTFTDSSKLSGPGLIVKWLWDFNDGTGDTLTSNTSRTHSYTSITNYSPQLSVISSSGCASLPFSQTLTIHPNPSPGFISPEVCLSDASASFIDSSKVSGDIITSWLWNFADPGSGAANTSTLKNPTHKYFSTGNYPVNLTVTTGNNCAGTILQTITVNGDKPKSSFNVLSPAGLCANDSIAITDASTVNFGGITRIMIFWDNNQPSIADTDYAPAAGKIYKHLYPNFQNPLTKSVTIRYRVYSGQTCFDEQSKVVLLNAVPKVIFSDVPSVCFNTAPFKITEARETGGVPGTESFNGAGITPSGLFSAANAGIGGHLVHYTYTSSAGCIDTASNFITVLAPPVGNFGYSDITCALGDITFSDSSISSAGTITKWTWDFNDGTPPDIRSSGAPIVHNFKQAGNYTVSLLVTTSDNCNSALVSKGFIVHPLPLPNFTISKTCLPLATAQFTNNTSISDITNSQNKYLWDFGDLNSGTNNTSALVNPSHIYSALGPYTIKLTTTSVNGCIKDTSIIYNDIHSQPVAKFIPSIIEACVGTTIDFTNQSTSNDGDINSYMWDFGDGYTSSVITPSHTFNTAGDLNIKLTVGTTNNCSSDPYSLPISIDAYPTVDAKPDRFVLEGDTIILSPVYTGTSLTYIWTPPDYLSSAVVPYPVLTGVNDRVYSIIVTGKGDCAASDKVSVKVLRMPKIPNTFTPNHDGINDFWIIENLQNYKSPRVQVFDRYGQTVFESTGYGTPWDGNYKGKPVPIGTYYYIIDAGNGRKPITGYVTVLK